MLGLVFALVGAMTTPSADAAAAVGVVDEARAVMWPAEGDEWFATAELTRNGWAMPVGGAVRMTNGDYVEPTTVEVFINGVEVLLAGQGGTSGAGTGESYWGGVVPVPNVRIGTWNDMVVRFNGVATVERSFWLGVDTPVQITAPQTGEGAYTGYDAHGRGRPGVTLEMTVTDLTTTTDSVVVGANGRWSAEIRRGSSPNTLRRIAVEQQPLTVAYLGDCGLTDASSMLLGYAMATRLGSSDTSCKAKSDPDAVTLAEVQYKQAADGLWTFTAPESPAQVEVGQDLVVTGTYGPWYSNAESKNLFTTITRPGGGLQTAPIQYDLPAPERGGTREHSYTIPGDVFRTPGIHRVSAAFGTDGSAASAVLEVEVLAPPAMTIQTPAPGSAVLPFVTVDGIADPSSTVTLTATGADGVTIDLGTVPADAGGAWQLVPDVGLPFGAVTISATSDAGGSDSVRVDVIEVPGVHLRVEAKVRRVDSLSRDPVAASAGTSPTRTNHGGTS